jgi:hypothetical protein
MRVEQASGRGFDAMIGDSFEGRLGLDRIWTRREVDLLAVSQQYLRDRSGDGFSGWNEVAGSSRKTSHHIVPLFLLTPWTGPVTPYHS